MKWLIILYVIINVINDNCAGLHMESMGSY
jgi:hypothetical protein